jgi:hypothetical protein
VACRVFRTGPSENEVTFASENNSAEQEIKQFRQKNVVD